MNSALVVPAPAPFSIPRSAQLTPNVNSVFEQCDSALLALTDFRKEYPMTAPPDRMLDDALADMKRVGVQALLVTRDDLDEEDHRVLGLITQYDVERKNPHRFPGGPPRPMNCLKVLDVMTTWTELSLVRYDSLIDLTVGDLFERFQGSGLTHLLVIETRIDDSAVARGLISRTMLAKAWRRKGTTWS